MIDFIITLLMVLEVLIALLLIGIILIQHSKTGGGLGAIGGGMTESVFGATAGNVLTKATVILAAAFLGITLILAAITGHHRPGQSVVEQIGEKSGLEAPADLPDETPALPEVGESESTATETPDTTEAEEAVPATLDERDTAAEETP